MSERFDLLPKPPARALNFSCDGAVGGEARCVVAGTCAVETPRVERRAAAVESTRGAHGFGITVGGWRNAATVAAGNVEHAATRAPGSAQRHDYNEPRVATVARTDGKKSIQ